MKNHSLGIAKLDIDNLSNELDLISKDNTRISRTKLDDIFRLIRNELAHTSQVINATLTAALYADSPHTQTDVTLNEVVYQMGRALYNSANVEPLAEAAQNYFRARKQTEKAYALTVTKVLLEMNDLKDFPEAAHPALQELALTITEKIINEKQSRRLTGYQPQSVLEMVRPFLYFRLASPIIENIKATKPQAFRKWIINMGQDSYEKVNDEKKFKLIRQEKLDAFTEFKNFISTKTLNKAHLARAVDKIRFSQTDRNKRQALLANQLQGMLSEDTALEKDLTTLRPRFHIHLNKLFNSTERNMEGLRSEEAISAAHAKAFDIVESDLGAVKKIIGLFTRVEKNYLKSMLASLLGKKNVELLNAVIIDDLLGAPVRKRDPNLNELVLVREGGYPQKNMLQIFDNIDRNLRDFSKNLSGPFTASLKREIEIALQELNSARSQLPVHPELEPAAKAPPPHAAASSAPAADTAVPMPAASAQDEQPSIQAQDSTLRSTSANAAVENSESETIQTQTNSTAIPSMANANEVSADAAEIMKPAQTSATSGVIIPAEISTPATDALKTTETLAPLPDHSAQTETPPPDTLLPPETSASAEESVKPATPQASSGIPGVTTTPLKTSRAGFSQPLPASDDVPAAYAFLLKKPEDETPAASELTTPETSSTISSTPTPVSEIEADTAPPVEPSASTASQTEGTDLTATSTITPGLSAASHTEGADTSANSANNTTPGASAASHTEAADTSATSAHNTTPGVSATSQPQSANSLTSNESSAGTGASAASFSSQTTRDTTASEKTGDTLPSMNTESDSETAPPLSIVTPSVDTPERIPTSPEKDYHFALEPSEPSEPNPSTEEKIIPKPLAIDVSFDDDDFPIIPLETVAVKESAESSETVDPGTDILKDYALGDLTSAVQKSWQVIREKASANGAGSEEQKTHLRIICELVQKVAAFNPDTLSNEKREILESITTLLLAALQDPLDENNWTFFEGKRRDDVNQAIALIGN